MNTIPKTIKIFSYFICLIFVNGNLIYCEEKHPSLNQKLIDLSRLSITHVTASSINGDRPLDNEYYGILNVFDDGNNYIKGINYNYWLSDTESQHWIKLSFDKPVLVNSVIVETTGQRRPKEYSLDFNQVSAESKNTIRYFESIPIKGLRTVYELKNPITNVSEIQINFPGPEAIEISEIRVFGKVLGDIDLTPQIPKIGLSKVSEKALKATRIRIRNVSPYDYDLLLVGKIFFGKLKSGKVTEYKIFERAYKYNYVRLSINDQVFGLTPQDYVGETPLGNGYFTYNIGVEDLERKILSIKAIEDK